MTKATEPEAITILIAVDDPVLAERLAVVLAATAGVQLVADGDRADVEIVSSAVQAVASLTAREEEVLALMAQGASNKSIANELGISINTAKFHVGRLIDKLDALGRTDAVVHAARIGVLRL